MKLFVDLESFADELTEFGQDDLACAVRETIRRARQELQRFWDEPLTVSEAAAWGDYSESQLRRLVKDARVAVTSDGRIRRRHVPVKPGYDVPLGLEPVDTGGQNWPEHIRQQREAS